MKINIYHHFPQDNNCVIIDKLTEIIDKLDLLLSIEEDETLKKEIMEKLNKAIADIRSTV